MNSAKSLNNHFLTERRYDIDTIRVLAFGILIFYHVGMFYVLDWSWHIKSQYQSEWLQQPMMFFNQWRMALLFTISGIATAILIHKAGSGNESVSENGNTTGFLKQRMSKLGWPLLFGIFVVVVPQAYFETVAKGLWRDDIQSGGFLGFWFTYVTFGEFPEDAFGGSDGGFTWNHLWYLPYIMFYTLATVAIRSLVKRFVPSFSAEVRTTSLWRWYAVSLLVLMFIGLVIYPQFPYRSHALIDDWYTHSLFFSFFALGYFLIRSKGIWDSLKRHKFKLLIIGVISYVSYRLVTDNYPQDANLIWQWSQLFLVYINRVTWILVIFAYAYSFLNRDSVWLRYSNKAVFSWYILHQTITVVLGGILSPYQLGGAVEFSLVLLGTILGCLVIHHVVVRPLPFLHRFFGYSASSTARTKNDLIEAIPRTREC